MLNKMDKQLVTSIEYNEKNRLYDHKINLLSANFN